MGQALSAKFVSMFFVSCFVFLFFNYSAVQAETSGAWSVAFYPSWDPVPVSAIYWPGMTHIVEMTALPRSNGSLDLTADGANSLASLAPSLVAAAHANNVKALFAIWQYPNSGSDFRGAITNHLSLFLDNIVNTINTYGFDGVDIDWEDGLDYPAMTTLLSGLRSRLETAKIITADVLVSGDYSYWGTQSVYLDRVNVMSYEVIGSWDGKVWHDAALYSPNGSVWSLDMARSKFIAGGVPAAKLNLGIPFFGEVVSGGCADTACTDGLYNPLQVWAAARVPTWTPQPLTYLAANYDITSANPNWHWDSAAHKPYLSINNPGQVADKFITFEDAQSVADKVNYIKSNNLGGWIIWELNQAYFPSGATAAAQNPLLYAMTQGQTTCTPTTCAVLGDNCGAVSDGCSGTLNCGTCSSGYSCTNNKCVADCAPTTCNALSYACGTVSDGCGGTLNCGTCSANQSCNSAGQCVSNCTPNCMGKVCGSNGCGGSCGACASSQICSSGSCVATCTPKSCADLGTTCGMVSDGCDGSLSCGTCASNQTCSNGICKTNGGGGGGGGSGGGSTTNPSVINKQASSMTYTETLAKIAQIQALIADLRKQLAVITGSTITFSCTQITKNLFYGMKNDPQVKCLQEVLKSQGYGVAPTGNYGLVTKTAVAQLQQKYAGEILAPFGLKYGSGNVGDTTRAKINFLLITGN